MNTADAAATGTREKLIEAAITLMRRSGLSGAGINEIVRESGAPKGSVYYFFPQGKQQIVKEGLKQYSERVVAFIDSSPVQQAQTWRKGQSSVQCVCRANRVGRIPAQLSCRYRLPRPGFGT